MYLYIYDSFLNHKRYANLLARIETRVTDLGIGGKIFRLSPLRNVAELFRDEIKGGVKTIIVVGNDKTFAHIINFAVAHDVTVGIIPIGSDNAIAKMLGVSSPEEAYGVIAARKIERVDLGKANDTYFLSGITIDQGDVTIECENKFRVRAQIRDQVGIYNLRPAAVGDGGGIFNPKDGILELLIQPFRSSRWTFRRKKTESNSLIPFRKVAIKSKGSVSIHTDGQKVLKTPVTIEIVPDKLKVIVGKDRIF